jgi:hypothetical protein
MHPYGMQEEAGVGDFWLRRAPLRSGSTERFIPTGCQNRWSKSLFEKIYWALYKLVYSVLTVQYWAYAKYLIFPKIRPAVYSLLFCF